MEKIDLHSPAAAEEKFAVMSKDTNKMNDDFINILVIVANGKPKRLRILALRD